MPRTLLLAFLLALLAGCGETQGGAEPTASVVQSPPPPTAGQLPAGDPPGAPEHGPPAAWVQTAAGPRWLGFSSYCWGTVCADAAAPTCGAPYVPTLKLERGETVELQLEFLPKSLSLSYLESPQPPSLELDTDLPEWKADRDGAFSVFAQVDGKDVSYVGCVRFDD